MSTPTTSATCGASAKAIEPVPQPASSAASFPVNGPSSRRSALGEIGAALVLQREPQLDAHDVVRRAARARARAPRRASRSSPLPAPRRWRRGYVRSPAPARDPARHRERAAPPDPRGEPPRPPRRAPAPRRTRARRAPTAPSPDGSGGSRAATDRRAGAPAAAPPRSASARSRSAGGEGCRRRRRRAGSRDRRARRGARRAVHRAARAGRRRRGGGSPTAESRSSSTSTRSPAGSVTSAAEARRSVSVRSSIRNPSSSSKRTARSRRSGSSTKIESETTRMMPASRSALPSSGSWVAPVPTCCDRVEGEVARREVRVDAVADGREVDGLVDAVDDDPPGAVPLGEREHRAAETAREAVRRVARLGAGDVEVEHGPLEELVADGAADDPRVLLAEDLAEALIHRRRPAGRGRSACSTRSRSRTRSCRRHARAPR